MAEGPVHRRPSWRSPDPQRPAVPPELRSNLDAQPLAAPTTAALGPADPGASGTRGTRTEIVGAAMTTTATGHRATLARCRCGLPAGGDGFDAATDPEPPDVHAVTMLGHAPAVTRWDRGVDGLWHPARTRYQWATAALPWHTLGVCASGRRHRLVAVG